MRKTNQTQVLGYYVCAVIKKEKLMPINPEFGPLTICSIMYCMAIINTEQWFTFQNVSFIAPHPVFPSFLILNSK